MHAHTCTHTLQKSQVLLFFFQEKNFVDPGVELDRIGHGTNVAGIAISENYGAAMKAKAISLGCLNSSDLLAAE